MEAAIQGLPQSGFYVIATSAAYEPQEFQSDGIPNCRVERYLSHGPIVERAGVVVCHGGMGITQRALAQGVPLVVVPFGRDQLEVARRVEHAGAGVRLLPSRLNAESLAAAVTKAVSMSHGAKRIADAFAAADGVVAAYEIMVPEAAGWFPWFDQPEGEPMIHPQLGRVYTQHIYVTDRATVNEGQRPATIA